jgi:hypothetical protein
MLQRPQYHGGNWFLANQEMLFRPRAALPLQHEWGDGARNSKQGGAILPAALRCYHPFGPQALPISP